ncbi:TPA: penicillin-binding protein 2 [Candidatus Uhrbacteria bacterium]|nr:penicillin-binding protein 2 [Candidatus Uhrbacteria bacterium]
MPAPSPFGTLLNDDLGALSDSSSDIVMTEVVGRRGRVDSEPVRAFVGNVIPAKRYKLGIILTLGLLSFFLARAGYFQIIQGSSYRAIAEANRGRTHILPAQRGLITDRNGIILAKNIPSFTLIGRSAELPKKEEARNQLFAQIAPQVGGDALAWTAAYETGHAASSFELMADVPYEQALAFAVHDSDVVGIDLLLDAERSYVTNAIPSLSHVMGYTGVMNAEDYATEKKNGYQPYDKIGKQGVESTHEAELRGTNGYETLEVNAQGKYLRTVAKQDPVDGARLTLSIDANLQQHIEQVLAGRLKGTVASRGAVVVMNPKNGEILALVSWPAYDANLFTDGISQTNYSALLDDPNHPLFPRATAGEYPSGSTIKPEYAAAALMEGIITPNTTVMSTGGLQTGNRFFPDWRPGGHGLTNVYHAIADSVNTFFYTIGGGYDTFKGLGIDRLMSWAATFGFGSKSGLDVPGEGNGFLPSPATKLEATGEPWYIGDTYNVSIGQGDFLVTPVQMARATSVFANDGILETPHLELGASTPETRVVTSEVAQVIKDAMRQTITNGSASSLQSVPVAVAGKTGTAQWSHSSPPHSWFTGFAPYDNPELTITTVIEEGGDAALAIPISREILEWYFAGRK